MENVARSRSVQCLVEVVENRRIARDTYQIRLGAPALARVIRPGQFVMLRTSTSNDPLLGRPFALFDMIRDASGQPWAIDVVYLVVGPGTRALSNCRAGDRLSAWGPLGNGFGPAPPGEVIFVAGGIGQTPFLALGRWWLGRSSYDDSIPALASTSATLLYGARTADYLAGIEDFRAEGISVEVATDDGSAGHRGFVTDLLLDRLHRGDRPTKVIGCGPPAMLASLSKIASEHGLVCDLSLENHMACGFGACFSCVTPIRQDDGSIDLKRVCVEGPIFDSKTVVW